eukprot:CAMPEP_0184492668 /NCGR_PEP_ID=MMETSP0113_2-20130426/23947_1 /TAXON_ID=91329 /ORGANISM="Norrisiella sphaerica, Strain BC52" /LENGTH=410 /DNA_ID=CAMNT_0026877601 /DNA_START=166 /DNA_END=1398 /DNA_ORIENTATION=-
MKSFFKKKETKGMESPPKSASPNESQSNNALRHDELLMEQLSTVSQELANTRMRKHELEQQNGAFRSKNEELEKQVNELQAQVKKISESFAFEEAQKTQEKVKELQTVTDEEKKRSSELQKQLKASKTRVAELEDRVSESDKEMGQLRTRIDEQLDEIRSKDESLSTLRDHNTDQDATIKDLQERLQIEREKNAAENERRIQELKSSCEERVKSTEASVHKLEGERNSYMQKCKTLQRELQKVLKKYQGDDIKKLKRENENLKSELDRRSKSLQNALSALDTYVSSNVGSRGTDNIDAAKGNHQMFTLQNEIKKLNSKLKEAEVQVHEKEMVITQLKKATHFFGERIIELEDRSRATHAQSKAEVVSPTKEENSASTPPNIATKPPHPENFQETSSEKKGQSDSNSDILP